MTQVYNYEKESFIELEKIGNKELKNLYIFMAVCERANYEKHILCIILFTCHLWHSGVG